MANEILIQGIPVAIGDQVTFKNKHTYDKISHSGKFIGVIHYVAAKEMFDIVAYHKNLIHSTIITDTPYTNMEYVVIRDENNRYFASAEEWMIENSFKKISENYIDVRIYNVKDEIAENEVMQKIRLAGNPCKKL